LQSVDQLLYFSHLHYIDGGVGRFFHPCFALESSEPIFTGFYFLLATAHTDKLKI